MPVTELCFPADDDAQSEIAQELDAPSDSTASPPPSESRQQRCTWLNFDRAFSSITKAAIRLRDARNSNNVRAISSLADVFLMCSRTIIHEIHISFPDSHSDASYQLSKSAAEFFVSLLHGKVKIEAQDTDVDTMLDVADMVLANLKELTRVALRATREKKPLPSVPSNINVSRRSGTLDGDDSSQADQFPIFDYELVDPDVDEESYPMQGNSRLYFFYYE